MPNTKTDSLGTAVVLSIDDDGFMREYVATQLDVIGVGEVVSTGSAAQALELLRATPRRIDVVLLDLNMPGMNGVEFIHKLRGHSNADVAEKPVIIVTDHADAKVAQGMAKFGIQGFLAKPVSPEALRTAIIEALEGRTLTPE